MGTPLLRARANFSGGGGRLKASGHGPGSGADSEESKTQQWPGGKSKARFRARLIQTGTKPTFDLFPAFSAR